MRVAVVEVREMRVRVRDLAVLVLVRVRPGGRGFVRVGVVPVVV